MSRCRSALALSSLILLLTLGCGSAKPWSLISSSAQDELHPTAQVRDRRLKADLRRALLAHTPTKVPSLSITVFMERGFIVGTIDDEAELQTIEAASQSVKGLRSLTLQLPVKNSELAANDLSLGLEVTARLAARADIVKSRVDVKMTNGRAVLLGVVKPEEQTRIVAVTGAVKGILGIDNFMLEPETAYSRRRRGLR